MGLSGSVAALLLGLLAAAGPTAAVVSEDRIDPAFDQGLTRSPTGWVVSGRDVLARLSDDLTVEQRLDAAIPAAWRERGFDHIGDVDLSGTTLYVPFEQPDYEEGRQAMARYDGRTLQFRDATIVDQHENSFVTVDRETGIAYSMDRFDGAALLRYDVRADWRRLPPLPLDRSLERVQGAAIARGAVWLSTDDADNGLYRVDIETGEVADLGPAPPVEGEGEGIDASDVQGDNLHATVVAPDRSSISLDHFEVTGEPDQEVATPPTQDASPGTRSDTSWPPALVYFAIALLIVALAAVGTIFWRARTTIRPRNGKSGAR